MQEELLQPAVIQIESEVPVTEAMQDDALTADRTDTNEKSQLLLRTVKSGGYLWFVAGDIIAIWRLPRSYPPYHAFRSMSTEYKANFLLSQLRRGDFETKVYKRSVLCIRQDGLIQFLRTDKWLGGSRLAQIIEQQTEATDSVIEPKSVKEGASAFLSDKAKAKEEEETAHAESKNKNGKLTEPPREYPLIQIQQTAGSNELLRFVARNIAAFLTSTGTSRLETDDGKFAPSLYLPVFDLAISRLIEENKAWVYAQKKQAAKKSTKKSKVNSDVDHDEYAVWSINQVSLNLLEIARILFPCNERTRSNNTLRARRTWIQTVIKLINNYPLFQDSVMGPLAIIEAADTEMDAAGNIVIQFSIDAVRTVQTSRFLKPLLLPVNLYFFHAGQERGRIHPYSFIANRSMYVHFRMNKNLQTMEHVNFTMHNFLQITCIPDYMEWVNSPIASAANAGRVRWFDLCVKKAFASVGLYIPHYERTLDIESIILDNRCKNQ